MLSWFFLRFLKLIRGATQRSSALVPQKKQPEQGIPCMLAPAPSLSNGARRTESTGSLGAMASSPGWKLALVPGVLPKKS